MWQCCWAQDYPPIECSQVTKSEKPEKRKALQHTVWSNTILRSSTVTIIRLLISFSSTSPKKTGTRSSTFYEKMGQMQNNIFINILILYMSWEKFLKPVKCFKEMLCTFRFKYFTQIAQTSQDCFNVPDIVCTFLECLYSFVIRKFVLVLPKEVNFLTFQIHSRIASKKLNF